MNIYKGFQIGIYAHVFKNAERLKPTRSFLHRVLSSEGFQWGYEGSGPDQLALAILLEETTEAFAVEHFQEFCRQVISYLTNNWILTSAQVTAFVARVQAVQGKGGDL